MAEDGQRPNLRAFLEKLQRRRKRIACSGRCRRSIEAALKKLGGKSLQETGRMSLVVLREILRDPPKGVAPQTLREFVDVASAYDVGDGSVNLRELIDSSLHTESIIGRFSCFMPLLVVLTWILLGPAVFCPAENWSYLNGLYFSVVSLTSLGTTSGLAEGLQVKPTYLATRIFLVIYVLLGAALAIWFLLSTSITLLWSYAKLQGTAGTDLLAEDGHGTTGGLPLEDLTADEPSKRAAPGATDVEGGRLCGEKPKTILEIHKESLRAWAKPRAKMLQTLVFWSSILFEGIFILAAGTILAFTTSQISFLDAVTWACFTALTLGYGLPSAMGDRIDATWARGLEVTYVLLSAACILHLMLRMGRRQLQQRALQVERERLKRILPMDLMADLDQNGQGVNRLEFLCACLLASDQASGSDLSQALEIFQRLDPHGSGVLQQPQLEALRRRKDPLSPYELLHSSELRSQLQAMHFPARKSVVDERTTKVLQKVYKDYDAVCRSLDAKDEELLMALREHSACEQARGQAVAQREALRKELALLSQAKTDVEERLEQELRQSRLVQKGMEELRTRTRQLEERLRAGQQEQDEAKKRWQAVARQLQEAELQSQEYQRRVQEAELEIKEFPKRLQEQAECLQHQADTRLHQVRLEAAQQSLERQEEVQTAQLELKALSSSMDALRLKSPSPTRFSSSSTQDTAARPYRGYEVWPLASRSDGSLLSDGKVKEHLEYLDSQVRRQVEHLSDQVQKHADSITAEALSPVC